MTKRRFILAGCLLSSVSAVIAWAAPKPADSGAASTSHSAAPTVSNTPAAKGSGDQGEYTIKGTRKEKLDVGKFDPPAAFNLEDIQNFPEERLQPVLNNPITFEEGRDFASMMDFQEDQLYHPWLPELSKSPFLSMKPEVDKPPKDWTFSIIDQGGATVSKQEGHGTPPSSLSWSGDDNVRDHVAVDTVYIPQLATTDKEGYHHTFMGQPIQFSSVLYNDHGKTIIELSSKRLFQDKKSEFTKEAPTLLDKVCDAIREANRFPFAIQPYDADSDLATARSQALAKYFSTKLYIPENQIVQSSPQGPEKRGTAIAIIPNSGG